MTVKSTSSAVIVLNPPKAPSALTGVLAFGPQITLSWTDNATNETGFAIERQLNGGPFVQVGTVAANVTTFVDTVANGLAPAATFGYRVIATNAIGPSLPSNVFTQVIPAPPAAPTNLTATLQALPAGPGPVAQVTLTFRDNANNETGFIVERSTNGAAFTALATLPPRTNGNSTVTYVDTTAAAGATPTTYAYRVTARGLFVQSAYTSTVSVVVPTLPATPTAFTAAQGPNGNGNSRSINLTFAGNNTANVTGSPSSARPTRPSLAAPRPTSPRLRRRSA